jgi:2-polyprenyl-3-methyl-5-hydroxy-6-metoxy-1,4-benzoquinol methylase
VEFVARSFYDKEGLIARRYDSINFWERRYHNKKAELIYSTLEMVDARNNMVLDAGCGSGELSKYLHEAGSEVVSLDISKSYLNRLRGVADHRICASIDHLPFKDQAFNTVLCADVIEHLPAYDEPLNENFYAMQWLDKATIRKIVPKKTGFSRCKSRSPKHLVAA